MTSYWSVTKVSNDIRGNPDFFTLFFFREPFFYRHDEAILYLGLCDICHGRNERVHQ